MVHVPSAWVQYIFVAREGGGVCGFTLLRDILKKNKKTPERVDQYSKEVPELSRNSRIL